MTEEQKDDLYKLYLSANAEVASDGDISFARPKSEGGKDAPGPTIDEAAAIAAGAYDGKRGALQPRRAVLHTIRDLAKQGD